MAKKKKKLTPNQQAYNKELRRIQQFVRRAEKRGFRFDTSIIPQKKRRVTKKDIEKAKQLTANKLYEKAAYLSPETGKVVSGTQGRTLERKASARKGQETKQIRQGKRPPRKPKSAPDYAPPSQATDVYDSVMEMMDRWQPKYHWSDKFQDLKRSDVNILKNILRGAVEREGLTAVARRMEQNATRVKDLTWMIIYGASGDKKDGVQEELVEFASIINGGAISREEAEALQDSFDFAHGK